MMKLTKYVILIPTILIFFNSLSFAAISGDANDNGKLDLADAIIILQTLVGLRPVPPPVPPPVPTGLTATAVSQSQINLSWTAVASATGYALYRGGTYWTTVAGTTASDTGLTASTQYCYTITSVSSSEGESAQSSSVCVATPTPPPPVPTGLTVTPVSASQLNIAWMASAGAAGYRIYKDGTYLKSVTTTSFTDTGLTASTTYCYSVSAFDVANNESAKTSQLCATTYGPPPAVPGGVTTSAVSPTIVDLSWTASAGAAQYMIYRNGVLLRTTTTASYSDTTAVANTAYIYTVTAIDATGSESGQSTQSSAHTGLTVPSLVTVTVNSKTQITVSWTNSGGVNVTGYRLYRDGVLRQPVTTTSFTDTGLTADTQYCYSVSSTDVSGNESAKNSQICVITTIAVPGNPTGLVVNATSDSQIAVSWTASAGAAG